MLISILTYMALPKDMFRDIGRSLNILSYGELKERAIRLPVAHFLLVLALSVLISGIVYIPSVISFSNSVKESLVSFERFQLNPDIETVEPAIIWSADFLVFDTQGNMTPNSSRYYVDSDFLYYDYGERRRELSRVGDIVENSEFLGNMILVLAVILLPSFLFTYLAVSLLLLGSIVLLTSGLVWGLLRLTRKKKKRVKYRDVAAVSLYASTILAVSLLLNAFGVGIGLYLMIIYLLYAYLGSVQKSRGHEGHEMKRKKKSSGDDE